MIRLPRRDLRGGEVRRASAAFKEGSTDDKAFEAVLRIRPARPGERVARLGWAGSAGGISDSDAAGDGGMPGRRPRHRRRTERK